MLSFSLISGFSKNISVNAGIGRHLLLKLRNECNFFVLPIYYFKEFCHFIFIDKARPSLDLVPLKTVNKQTNQRKRVMLLQIYMSAHLSVSFLFLRGPSSKATFLRAIL